jgi:ketosteroid isomerase-like protein
MPHDTPESSAARRGIDAANRRYESAFNAGDPGRAAREVYTRDARVLPPGAPLVRGRDEIIGFWQAAVQQMDIRKVVLETVELDVHGEHAHEIGRATLTVGGDQQVVAKYVVIWKREDGEWRWDVDIWNTDA